MKPTIKRLSYVVILILVVISCCYLNKSFASTITQYYSTGNNKVSSITYYHTRSVPDPDRRIGFTAPDGSLTFLSEDGSWTLIPFGGSTVSIKITNVGEGT
jgi:hypothetical protein